MSVICQNFVQNTWKKDLCSNCFKSVGDHENGEIVEENSLPIQNQSESVNGRYVSQASTVSSSRSNANPHTTWKSLINERNGKNSQPFNLETGFQGRLLTINKANGTSEKKIYSECNGHVPKLIENSNIAVNGYCKAQSNKTDTSQLSQKTKPLTNGFKASCNSETNSNQNGTSPMNCNGISKQDMTSLPEKCSVFQSSKSNGNFTEITMSNKTSEKKHFQAKFSKSNSQESLSQSSYNGVLQGILKKATSTPTNINNLQQRRGSNVGFIDEEPLVIGYGGRDFTPEELEWDMAPSDGEPESAGDSLDETEDDKAFSTMTKQNTAFNSDNANLLKNNTNKVEIHEQENCQRDKTVNRKLGGKILKRNLNVNHTMKTEINNKGTNSTKSLKSTKEKDGSDVSGTEIHDCELEINRSRKGNNVNGEYFEGGSGQMENSESLFFKSNKVMDEMPVEEKVHRIATSTKNVKVNDSINVAIDGDKTNHAVKSARGETVVKETTSEAEVKNSQEYINGTPPDSHRSPDGRENCAEMFTDAAEEKTWREEDQRDLETGCSEWSEESLPGQILQAINTSLTNRHKMREGDKSEHTSEENQHNSENILRKSTETLGPEKERTDDCSGVQINTLNPDEETDSSVSVEPRGSFLHGPVSSENVASKPSAIYGPASDLFVSRSDSSSSSSSDELSKSQISINVIVKKSENRSDGNDNESDSQDSDSKNKMENKSDLPKYPRYKPKPKVAAKPSKQSPLLNKLKNGNHFNGRSVYDNFNLNEKPEEEDIQESEYYSSVVNESGSITLVDHYAESNIYHEVNIDPKIEENDPITKPSPARETKLAALAMELEQVRHNGTNMKRQAPPPPKIPDPPQEDPPSCLGRNSPTIADAPLGFSSFKGEAMAFSSASSTTSNSSQDTETGYASWNLNGGSLTDEHPPKYPKSSSKSSFLLTQYSKCKQMAINYAEDGARARKRFSLKKLLKIGKESESSINFDPSSANQKAWKYNDHFEKPRAKLEIIHPMDLEIKTVTVNPGFDSLNQGSMSSFTSSADDLSFRNSVSSDYGSFYSDTLPLAQDSKTEANYEYIQPRIPPVQDKQEGRREETASCSTTSPTPSRSSVGSSQGSSASSSKNGITYRPPKPPPPPRAHSLLPANKILRNADGTFKFPLTNTEISSNEENISTLPTKPQAPRRQCKSSTIKSEYSTCEEQNCSFSSENEPPLDTSVESIEATDQNVSISTITANNQNTTFSVQINDAEMLRNVQVKKEPGETLESSSGETSPEIDLVSSPTETMDIKTKKCSSPLNGQSEKIKTNALPSNSLSSTSITISAVSLPDALKTQKSLSSQNKNPISKAPTRPPPIYSKPIPINFVKNPNPWKTLEDSYLVLTSSNRELLIKLVNQALKKKKEFLLPFHKVKFQWSDFEIDASQPSSVFAFGEKIAYHATMPNQNNYSVTLVLTIQQHQNRFQEVGEMKYPVMGQFTDYIPSELLEDSCDAELQSMQARVLVLSHSSVTTVECFIESLPNSLTQENEKELCFIILQLIQSLKSLQAQGIESMDTSFQNLILAKTDHDTYHTLIFLSDSCYDENDYSSDSSKISLCQYALMFLFQVLKVQSVDEFMLVSDAKLQSPMARKVYQACISILTEEKAISLSLTKVLLECFLWGVTKVIESLDETDDIESMLHRWLDIERSSYIKNVINKEASNDINTQSEYLTQFLIRTSVRTIREVASYL